MTQTLAVALSLGVASVSRAAPSPDTSSEFASERARSLYEAGLAKFDAGDYEGALIDLDESLEVETKAKSLYAKAQSLNKLGRCREAVPIYNRVLTMLPDSSPATGAVKDALVMCAEKLVSEDADEEPVDEADDDANDELEDDESDEPQNRWYTDVVAPVLIGAGLVGVTVGGVFLSRASGIDPENAPSYGDFSSQRDEQRSAQITGGVAMGVGAALVLGGVVRYVVVASRGRKSADLALVPTASPRAGRWSVGLGVAGRF